MKINKCCSAMLPLALLSVALCLVAQLARADSFEQFTAAGVFLDKPVDNTPATLSGGFIVDETTGTVASVDFFHGTTELNILLGAGIDASNPNLFNISVTNSAGDVMGLPLVLQLGESSLAGYPGGAICSDFFLMGGNFPACGSNATGGVSGAFTAFLTKPEADDVYIGVVLDTGPATPPTPVPEPGTLAMGMTALGGLLVKRRLPGLRLIRRIP